MTVLSRVHDHNSAPRMHSAGLDPIIRRGITGKRSRPARRPPFAPPSPTSTNSNDVDDQRRRRLRRGRPKGQAPQRGGTSPVRLPSTRDDARGHRGGEPLDGPGPPARGVAALLPGPVRGGGGDPVPPATLGLPGRGQQARGARECLLSFVRFLFASPCFRWRIVFMLVAQLEPRVRWWVWWAGPGAREKYWRKVHSRPVFHDASVKSADRQARLSFLPSVIQTPPVLCSSGAFFRSGGSLGCSCWSNHLI